MAILSRVWINWPEGGLVQSNLVSSGLADFQYADGPHLSAYYTPLMGVLSRAGKRPI